MPIWVPLFPQTSSPFASLVDRGYPGSAGPMFLSYWGASAYCRPYPADQVDAEIPPLSSIEDGLQL
jgi:hypothetical protein